MSVQTPTHPTSKKLWTAPKKNAIFILCDTICPLLSPYFLLNKWQYFLSNLNIDLCLLAKIVLVLMLLFDYKGGILGYYFKCVIPRAQMENSFLLVCQCLSTSIGFL